MLRTAMHGARLAPEDRTDAALRHLERRAVASKRDRLLADVGLNGVARALGRWPEADPLRDARGLSARSLALDGLR